MSESSFQVQTQDHWTDDQIADFWDWASQQQSHESKYFTKIFGDALVRIFPDWICRAGDILDYGCGRGNFTGRLLGLGTFKVSVADTSPESIQSVVDRHKADSNFGAGVVINELPIDLPADSFDAVTFFETIEHIRAESIAPTLKEHFRLLRSGGRLFLTTPNAEDLQAGHVYCPFCRSEFHRMQHFNRFDVEDMTGLLEDAGFKVVRCEGTDLHRYEGFRAKVMSWLRFDLRKLLGVPIRKPNLVAVAEKP